MNTIKTFEQHTDNKLEFQFSLEDVMKAIELARELTENKNVFDIESILGCTEVCTSSIHIKYTEDEIIQTLIHSKK